MNSYNDGTGKNKRPSKLIAFIIATAVLVLGGSVAAFVLHDNNTLKADYFFYEKNTMDMFSKQFKDRFGSELAWYEQSMEKPIENTYNLTAEINTPLSGSTGYISPEQIVNNSTITLTTKLDRQEKLSTAVLKSEFGNFAIEDINFYLTTEELMVGLPFLNEVLQLKGDDFGSLMQQFDPLTFTGEEKLNLTMFFEGNIIATEEAKYIEEEYIKTIYDALPEEAFQTTNEAVNINNKSVNTEKITFHLTEKQMKEIIKDTITRMASDEKLKGIIVKYLQTQGTDTFVIGDHINLDLPDFEQEYENVMHEALNGLESFHIPDGFTSSIWVHDKIIVKRDFSIEMGPAEEQLVTFYITGELSQGESDVSFSYDFGVVEQDLDHSVTLKGDLSNDNGIVNDKISIAVPDGQLVYESKETTKASTKEFERVFSLTDPTGYQLDLNWSGNAEYNGDQMSSSHELTFAADMFMDDPVVLHINRDAKVIDKIDFPVEDEVKDIGSMSANEIMIYYETEVVPQFEKWMMGIMGFGF